MKLNIKWSKARIGIALIGLLLMAFVCFFILSVCYAPPNASEILDESVVRRDLKETLKEPHPEQAWGVARVYHLSSARKTINLRFVCNIDKPVGNWKLPVYTFEDEKAPSNIVLEGFIVSRFANKAVAKKLWQMEADESADTITFTGGKLDLRFIQTDMILSDIKLGKDEDPDFFDFKVALRATVKPGCKVNIL